MGIKNGYMNITANSYNDLICLLKQEYPGFPDRGEQGHKDKFEIWAIYNFLARLAEELFIFPITVNKRESPDLEVIELSSNRKWGIEITEAVDQNYAKAEAIGNKENDGYIIPTTPDKYFNKKMTIDESRNMNIKNGGEFVGKPWVGDRRETIWSQLMIDAINKKEKQLKSYTQYDVNCLYIYDNASIPLRGDMELSLQRLQSNFPASNFDHIFIKSNNSFYDFTRQNLTDIKYVKLGFQSPS